MKVYVVLELPVSDHGHTYGHAKVQGVYEDKKDAEAWVEKHRPNWRAFHIAERTVKPKGGLGPSDEEETCPDTEPHPTEFEEPEE